MTYDPTLLTAQLKSHAYQLGFDHCRVVPIGEAPHADFFAQWLAADRAGDMTYLTRNFEMRHNPALLLEQTDALGGAQSLIVLAVNYHQFSLPPHILNDPSRGIIASYAWGDDYHELIRPLLYELDEWIRQQSGRTTPAKCLVDTGPVLERDWAMQAGLGFTGKNCCTIHPSDGSWLLLATMVVPERLLYDSGLHLTDRGDQPGLHEPEQKRNTFYLLSEAPADGKFGSWSTADSDTLTCGRCTRCLDACPTNAFVSAFHLDPQRCIAYWTIETQRPIPPALRAGIGNRIFGCDICQEVCPWNARQPDRTLRLAGLVAQENRVAPPLLEGFASETPYWLHPEAFAAHFRRSPIKRAKRHGMARTVCVALGNWGDPTVIPALKLALHDTEPIVRQHAAWALGEVWRKHKIEATCRELQHAAEQETMTSVLQEIALALGK